MKIIEQGLIREKYHYIHLINSQVDSGKTVVIFPPTMELLFPLHKNPKPQINTYTKLLPVNQINHLYIFGYDPNVSTESFSFEIAADFATFIRENIGPCIIMGISYGGAIAIPFAQKYPELTQKLILLVSSYAVSEQGLQLCNNLIKLAESGKMLKLELKLHSLYSHFYWRFIMKVNTLLRWPFIKKYMNPSHTFINTYKHLVKYNYGLEPYIHGIQAPTLLVGGNKDQFFSSQIYQELARALLNVNFVLFKGIGHVAPVEKYFKVKKLVADHIRN